MSNMSLSNEQFNEMASKLNATEEQIEQMRKGNEKMQEFDRLLEKFDLDYSHKSFEYGNIRSGWVLKGMSRSTEPMMECLWEMVRNDDAYYFRGHADKTMIITGYRPDEIIELLKKFEE